MSSTDIARTRAAASSTARGSPSRRATTRRTASGSSRTAGPSRTGALPEELGCRGVVQLGQGEHPLRGDGERCPGRRDDPEPGTGRDEEGDEVRDRGDDLLAVVEDEQRGRRLQDLGDAGPDVRALGRGEDPPTHDRVADAEGRADLADDVLRGGDADELDDVDDRLLGLVGEQVGQTGLPETARAEDRHDPGLPDRGTQRADVVVAPDEPGRVVPDSGADRAVRGEELAVDGAQGRPGVDPEPVRELAADRLVPLERGGGAPHRGEGSQQGHRRRLVRGVRGRGARGLEEGECLVVLAEGGEASGEHEGGGRARPGGLGRAAPRGDRQRPVGRGRAGEGIARRRRGPSSSRHGRRPSARVTPPGAARERRRASGRGRAGSRGRPVRGPRAWSGRGPARRRPGGPWPGSPARRPRPRPPRRARARRRRDPRRRRGPRGAPGHGRR